MARPSHQNFIDAANAVYQQSTSLAPSGLTPFVLSNQSSLEHLDHGFYAQVYLAGPNNVIISFEGSNLNPLDTGTFSVNSKLADAKLALGQTPQALLDAINFASAAVTEITNLRNSNLLSGGAPVFYVTGHSLGGTEAQAAAKALGSSIAGGETFGGTGLPGYYRTGEGAGLINYIEYGDPVGNYAHDAGFSHISLTGNHYGSIQYTGNSLARLDIQLVDKTLFAGSRLEGPAYTAALASVLAPELYFHQLKVYGQDLGLYPFNGPAPIDIPYNSLNLTSNVLSTAVPVIAAKTQPTGSPLPPPAGGYTITPNSASLHETDGTVTFTIRRADYSQAATVYVSTVHDQGTDNPNGNFYYEGLLNQRVDFDAGSPTAQVQLTINDQGFTSGSENFRLMVQQNATDPLGTYLASTVFTIVNNHAGIVANASVNEPTNTTFTLQPFLSLPAPPAGTTVSLVNFINTHSGPGALTNGGVATSGNIAVAYANVDQVGFATGSVTGSDRIQMYATYSNGTVSNIVELTVNIQSGPIAPVPPPQTPSGPVVNSNVQPLQVVVGHTGTLSSANLNASDSAYPDPSQLTYTITQTPTQGVILNNGQLAHSFTQADINAGHVTYQTSPQPGLSSELADSFTYIVSDPSFRQSATTTASLKVEPAPAPPAGSQPYIDLNSFQAVRQGSQVFVLGVNSAVQNLHVTDPNPNIPANYTGSSRDSLIVYTVVEGPSHGQLVWNTANPSIWLPGQPSYFGQPVTRFSQTDLNNGWFVYKNDFTSGAADRFTFTVSDGFGGTIGLTTANIPVQPVSPLLLRINAGAFVTPGGQNKIESHWLFAEDFAPNAYANGDPVFQVVQAPQHGTVLVNGVAASTFTQLDVTRGLVSYRHDGSAAANDQFTITLVSDAYGNTIPNIFVPIKVAANALDVNAGGAVDIGQSLTIGAASLHAAVPGVGSGNSQAELPSNVLFTITALPQHGTLNANGATLTVGGQFTQDQLDKNLLTYTEDGSASASDAFAFSISDVFGHNFGSGTFNISIVNSNGGRIFSGASASDIFFSGPGNNWVGGGTGTTVSYSLAPAGVTVNLANGTASNGYGGTDTLSNIHSVIGSPFGDTLISGPGNDTLDGGAGTDTADYSSATQNVVVDLPFHVAISAQFGTDSLTNIENVKTGSGNDAIAGDAAVNILDGGPGNDTISYYAVTSGVVLDLAGGVGVDGTSRDTLLNFENANGTPYNDAISGTEGANVLDGLGGNDTISYYLASRGVTIDLSGNVAVEGNVTDIIRNFENVNGSQYDDAISGNSGANVLDGLGGIDTLSYYQSSQGLVIDLAFTVVKEGAVTDIVLNFENVNATAYNDAVSGNAGANVLNGLAGVDTVSYYASAQGVTIDLSAGTAISGGVTDTLLNFENVNGSAYADTIIGDGGPNVLNGLGGADTLTGGAGFDAFVFTAGQANGDTITDFTGNGAAAGDALTFTGFGTTAQGATFTQVNASQWQIHSGLDGHNETITLSNAAGVHASDYFFV